MIVVKLYESYVCDIVDIRKIHNKEGFLPQALNLCVRQVSLFVINGDMQQCGLNINMLARVHVKSKVQ